MRSRPQGEFNYTHAGNIRIKTTSQESRGQGAAQPTSVPNQRGPARDDGPLVGGLL